MICIKEVGVDLELCVHAHENDVVHLGSFLQMIIQLYDSFSILELTP